MTNNKVIQAFLVKRAEGNGWLESTGHSLKHFSRTLAEWDNNHLICYGEK